MIVIGIDIGITGAVAAVDSRGTCAVHDIPTMDISIGKKARRRIAARELIFTIRSLVPPGESAVAVYEDVHARAGNGSIATASLLHSRGIVEAVLEIARIDSKAIQPATWKRHFGLLKTDKSKALGMARERFPLRAHDLKRQKDHNRAEALLMALYVQEVEA